MNQRGDADDATIDSVSWNPVPGRNVKLTWQSSRRRLQPILEMRKMEIWGPSDPTARTCGEGRD